MLAVALVVVRHLISIPVLRYSRINSTSGRCMAPRAHVDQRGGGRRQPCGPALGGRGARGAPLPHGVTERPANTSGLEQDPGDTGSQRHCPGRGNQPAHQPGDQLPDQRLPRRARGSRPSSDTYGKCDLPMITLPSTLTLRPACRQSPSRWFWIYRHSVRRSASGTKESLQAN
jgi:hypothetical protein